MGNAFLYATIIVIALVILAIAQIINQRRSTHRRIVMRDGPVLDRFVDASKAVKPDELVLNKDDAKLKVMNWWERSGVSEGVCGVCSTILKRPDGYLVPVTEVVKSGEYLETAMKSLLEFGTDPETARMETTQLILAEQTPWLVCDECIGMFFRRN